MSAGTTTAAPGEARTAATPYITTNSEDSTVTATDYLLAELAAFDPVRLAAGLSLLDATDPLLIAARVGVEVGDLRRAHRRALVEASHDIAGAPVLRGYSTRHVPFEELQRRRAVPGPMARGGAA